MANTVKGSVLNNFNENVCNNLIKIQAKSMDYFQKARWLNENGM